MAEAGLCIKPGLFFSKLALTLRRLSGSLCKGVAAAAPVSQEGRPPGTESGWPTQHMSPRAAHSRAVLGTLCSNRWVVSAIIYLFL